MSSRATRHIPARWLVVGAVVVAIGAWLRWQVWRTIPSFFGPGDPAIYFGMGRGVLREGSPMQDFLHHFLTHPRAIHHMEDYYEPVFGYMVAAAMAIFGRTPQDAAGLSFVAGTLAIPFAGLLALPRGRLAAVLAMAIVALEPWSIYYSGVLMKEAVVALLTLSAFWGTTRILRADEPIARHGPLLAAIAIAVGVVQYESLPILLAATGITLLFHRRRLFLPFGVTAILLIGALALVTWRLVGVPISAKLQYVAGVNPGDPSGARAMSVHRSDLIPLSYVVLSTLRAWYPALIILGVCGLTLHERRAPERTWILAYLCLYLWLHGVPQDLWSRDFIVLTALLAVPAGEALASWREWGARPLVAAIAWGLIAYLALTPLVLSSLHGLGRFPLWAKLASPLPVFGLLAWAVSRLLAGPRTAAVAAFTSMIFGATLLLQFWLAIPYPSIRLDPEFPDYEVERARRQRVSEWMRAQVPRAPVLAGIPEEVAYYSGFPAVIMPEVLEPTSFKTLIRDYRIRYVLATPGLLPERVLAPVRPQLLGEEEGYVLYRVRAGTDSTASR